MTDRAGEQDAGAAEAESVPPNDVAGEQAPPAPGGGDDEAGAPGELQVLRDRYLRLAAEYENYRKRTDKERGESWGRAQGQIVQQLIDPLDDLQRVALIDPETATVKAVLDGVQMVEKKLLRLLEAAGLEILDASGQPFDPSVHEAIMTAPAERQEEDESVGQVFQKGYRFKGDLLRPARVQVRKFGG